MKMYKDVDGKDIEPEWKQMSVVHCPDADCDGMLLQSKYYHTEKCSKCGKLWDYFGKYHEVKEIT